MNFLDKIKSHFSEDEQNAIELFLVEVAEQSGNNISGKQNDYGTPVELKGIGEMNVGAPYPIILADEHKLSIAYYLDNRADDWDGTTCKVRNPKHDDEFLTIVNMSGVHEFSQHTNGNNHSAVGLPFNLSHSVWEIRNSAKVSILNGDSEEFKHLVLGFHDTTIHCLCREYSVEQIKSTVYNVMDKQMDFVFADD